MTKRFYNWCFTSFDLTEFEELPKGATYLIYGRKVCPKTEKKHLQGYIEFETAKQITALKEIFGEGVHCEKRLGTQDQAIDYCKKEGDWIEFGERKKQGKRTNLDEERELVLEGASDSQIETENDDSNEKTNKMSKGEMAIQNWIVEREYFFKREYTVKINDSNLRFDFYVPDFNCLIEFDDKQHFDFVLFFHKEEQDFITAHQRDLMKDDFARKHNVNLFRIPYWQENQIPNILNDTFEFLSKKTGALLSIPDTYYQIQKKDPLPVENQSPTFDEDVKRMINFLSKVASVGKFSEKFDSTSGINSLIDLYNEINDYKYDKEEFKRDFIRVEKMMKTYH